MISSIRFMISVVLSLVVLAFIAVTDSLAQTDSAAISRQFLKFQQALATRDTNSVGDFYAEDAVSLLQNQPTRRGRNSIIQRWKRSFAMPVLIQANSLEINVSSSGQDAFQFGNFFIHSADTTRSLLGSGKVLFLWRKQSDRWNIILEMDSFNAEPLEKSSPQVK